MSTVGSIVDSVKGTAQDVVSWATGSEEDKAKSQDYKEQAQAEDAVSHAAVKAGPITMTPSGATTESTDRTEGEWKQTLGSGKQAIGGLVGSTSLKQQGEQQVDEGKAQQAKGELTDLGQGVTDRVGGFVDGLSAAVTGDPQAQNDAQSRRNDGRARIRDLELKAEQEEAASKH